MLVLSRKADQKVCFPGLGITVHILQVKGSSGPRRCRRSGGSPHHARRTAGWFRTNTAPNARRAIAA